MDHYRISLFPLPQSHIVRAEIKDTAIGLHFIKVSCDPPFQKIPHRIRVIYLADVIQAELPIDVIAELIEHPHNPVFGIVSLLLCCKRSKGIDVSTDLYGTKIVNKHDLSRLNCLRDLSIRQFWKGFNRPGVPGIGQGLMVSGSRLRSSQPPYSLLRRQNRPVR